ncbi:MOSC domain-containing protein [Streptomyces sp. BI20]|uniref:MOSC domain-containing protein n=1 Tax=Streptomyces sp. BI20 TaxID=3403460 RepID=UPI003C72A252
MVNAADAGARGPGAEGQGDGIRVGALYVHPVKSLAGVGPDAVEVEPWGFAGDRRWLPVDPSGTAVTQRQLPRLALLRARPARGGAVVLSGPGVPELTVSPPAPGPTETVTLFSKKVEAVPAGAVADAWFTAALGTPVRLMWMDDPAVRRPVDPEYARPGETVSFADGYPVLLTSDASLAALNVLIAEGGRAEEGPVPMSRFRPNLVVTGAEAWAEDGWGLLRIGGVEFRGARECGRCVVTTVDQLTAERGREPLRTLGVHRRRGRSLVFGRLLVPLGRGTVRRGDAVRVLPG